MWTVIYITQNKDALDKLREAFEKNSIIVKVREVNQSDDNSVYEVLVPESEISQAHEILLSLQIEK